MNTYFNLLDAVKNEDLSYLQDIIEERQECINSNVDEDGIKCIHLAAGLENACILELLLENGAAVNSQTSDGLTALHIAAIWGRAEQVETLLKYGADPLLVDATGCNALMHAVNSEEDGSQACADFISSHQENLNSSSLAREEDNVRKTPEVNFRSLDDSPWVTPRRGSRRKNSSRDPVKDRQESFRHNDVDREPISGSDIDVQLYSSPWVTPRRGSRRKNSNRDPVPDRQESFVHNTDDLETTSKSDNDVQFNGSPWVTPRRGAKNSKRQQANNVMLRTANRRLSAAFENFTNEDSSDVESSKNWNENFEELLTELSSGLLSSSGHDSFTDSNSRTFSYSTITGIDSQRLASLSDVDCSDYRTTHGSGLLTECSASVEFDEEEEGNKDEIKADKCGVVGEGEMRGKCLRVEDIDGVSDEETCVYETADEGMAHDLQEVEQIRGSDIDNEMRMGCGNGNEEMKEGGIVLRLGGRKNINEITEDMNKGNKELMSLVRFGETSEDARGTCMQYMKGDDGNENSEKANSDAKMNRNSENVQEKEENAKEEMKSNEESTPRKKHQEEEKQQDDIVEKKDQNRNGFNLNNHFNNLSVMNHEIEVDSFKPTLNPFVPPLNSTFLVESPLQQESKKPLNFFIPMENDKPSSPKTKSSAPNSPRNPCEETIIYDWRELLMNQRNETIAIIPASYKKISCNELRKRIKDHGHIPGPITAQTKTLYVKKLWKMDQGIGKRDAKDSSPCRLYPVEIRLILTGKTEIPDCSVLEQDMMKEFCKSPRKVQWRGGTEKSSFNYLLLDPRVTLDLPQRSKKLSSTEAFRSFVLSIFYVGKGKRSRPYAHLHEAVKYSKSKSNAKLDQIWDIWKDGLGVISLHLFQNAIPVESFTREACMLEAMGLSQLTNQKRGEYYGICANLHLSKKRKLGIYFLYKAYKIFLQEGERQICKEDL